MEVEVKTALERDLEELLEVDRFEPPADFRSRGRC